MMHVETRSHLHRVKKWDCHLLQHCLSANSTLCFWSCDWFRMTWNNSCLNNSWQHPWVTSFSGPEFSCDRLAGFLRLIRLTTTHIKLSRKCWKVSSQQKPCIGRRPICQPFLLLVGWCHDVGDGCFHQLFLMAFFFNLFILILPQ